MASGLATRWVTRCTAKLPSGTVSGLARVPTASMLRERPAAACTTRVVGSIGGVRLAYMQPTWTARTAT
eukprot:scaffold2423_cov113-Isochrysis_galbana.AAC.7